MNFWMNPGNLGKGVSLSMDFQCSRVSEMKNSVDPDQTASLRSSLIWVCTVFFINLFLYVDFKVYNILNML